MAPISTRADATVVVGVLLAIALWFSVFRWKGGSIWARSVAAGDALCAYALVGTAISGRLDRLFGPVSATEVGIGLVVGLISLPATHAGVAVVDAVWPSLAGQLTGLYGRRGGDRVPVITLALLLMSAGEELFFRGLVRLDEGWLVALAVYVGVQAAAGVWALLLAALTAGAMWTALVVWRHGVVAAIVAHAVWTIGLTLLWRLDPSGPRTRSPAMGPGGRAPRT